MDTKIVLLLKYTIVSTVLAFYILNELDTLCKSQI